MKLPYESKAGALIEQEVKTHGPMPFDRFMDIALYHPTYGYYQQKTPRRGKSGDYFTSPQVSGLFAKIFAEAVVQMRDTLESDQFSLIEVGAGDGEFLLGVLKALETREKLKGIRIIAVERSRPAREKLFKALSRFPKTLIVSSLDEVDIVGGLEGCIFSNELFDAVPFQRLHYNGGGWEEICLDVKREHLIETTKPVAAPVQSKGVLFAPGQEIETRPVLNQIIAEWGTLFNRGFIVTIDYGYPRQQLYSPHRMQGTWLCYHKHQAHQRVLERIGEQDITAHIDFTQLIEEGNQFNWKPVLFSPQGLFLAHIGKDIIETWLKGPEVPAPRYKVAAVQQLMHPDAMGDLFKVLVQAKETPVPDIFQAIPNRLRHLGV